MVEDEPPQTGERESELVPGAREQAGSVSELRDHVPAEIRNASFPLALRGYSRWAVDAYVERVNRLIAELEVGRSPRAAVRHALDRVGEQVGGILQRARETAEEITSSARQEAEETTARARAEAAELVVNASDEADRTRAEAEKTLARSRAEAAERLQRSEEEVAALQEQAEVRMRELQADTEAVWEERRELLEAIRALAARLEQVASEAAARFPPREPAERAEEGTLERETEPTGVAATDGPAGAIPAAASHKGVDDEPPEGEAE